MRLYMTEEEAKKKNCPILYAAMSPLWLDVHKMAGEDWEFEDRMEEMTEKSNCQASDCMWWGWQEDKPECEHGRCEAPDGTA